MDGRFFDLRRLPPPAVPLVAPLLGLLYIVVLPFIGLFFTLISLIGYRGRQGVAAWRHRTAHVTIDAW